MLASILKQVFSDKRMTLQHIFFAQVPVNRGVWFIKMSAAHQLAISETSKTKKRQIPDPTVDWTSTMVKFLKEQLSDIGKLIQVCSVINHQSLFSRAMSKKSLFENLECQIQWEYPGFATKVVNKTIATIMNKI